jgi:hypothetical protein
VIAGVAQLPGVDSVVPILFCQAHGVAIGVGRRLRDRGGRPRCGHGDALGLSRWLDGNLFGVSRTDSATYAGVAAFICVITLVTTYIPARRAANVNPIVALRE